MFILTSLMINSNDIWEVNTDTVYGAQRDDGPWYFVFTDRVKYIQDGAFANSRGFYGDVDLPASVIKIGSNPFANCPNLVRFTVDSNNKKYSSYDGMIFDKDKLTLIACPSGKEGSFNLPQSTTRIAESAFNGCKKLNGDFALPHGDRNLLDSNAFYNCIGLTSVSLSSTTLKKIGSGGFYKCINLESITLPDGLQYIYSSAFNGCSKLNNVKIPDSVMQIGATAFKGCIMFTSVNIPDNLNDLNHRFTSGIEDGAFSGCSKLNEFVVSDNCKYYSLFDGILYNKMKSVLITCPGPKSSNPIFPESLLEIMPKAFEDCLYITKIILPDGVEKIANNAFNSVKSLTTVLLPASIKVIEENAFFDLKKLKTIIFLGLNSVGDRNAFGGLPQTINVYVSNSYSDKLFCGLEVTHCDNPRGKIDDSSNPEPPTPRTPTPKTPTPRTPTPRTPTPKTPTPRTPTPRTPTPRTYTRTPTRRTPTPRTYTRTPTRRTPTPRTYTSTYTYTEIASLTSETTNEMVPEEGNQKDALLDKNNFLHSGLTVVQFSIAGCLGLIFIIIMIGFIVVYIKNKKRNNESSSDEIFNESLLV